MGRQFQEGDPVIYRMSKRSDHPGSRAINIMPSAHGETYLYNVDKFWRVKEILQDGRLLLETRRGKTHVCDPGDVHLRRPGFLTRLMMRSRFPEPHEMV